MCTEKNDNPWLQKMALVESLSDEQKIQLYPQEYTTILKCAKIPQAILHRILGKEATLVDQLIFLRNEHITEELIKTLAANTSHDYARELAQFLLNEKEETLSAGREEIRKLAAN